MALKDQIHIYSVDTSAFATDKELAMYLAMGKLRRKVSLIDKFILETNKRRHKFDKSNLTEDEERIIKRGKKRGKHKNSLSHSESLIENCKNLISSYNKEIANIKSKLKEEMKVNNLNNIVRELRPSHLKDSNIIALFESSLSRTLKIKPRLEVYDDILIVQVYYFEVLQDLVMHGFLLNGEKYSYYGSSAGQIKTKKAVFLKESRWVSFDEKGNEKWTKYGKTLMCGLTFKEINEKSGEKGINPNKFNSYLSLNNSATDTFTAFTIDDAIVVDDFETLVYDKVDYIHTDTFKIERSKYMDVPINQMDGCGIMLPSVYDKAFMVRAPFIKGLLVPFDFAEFIRENDASPIVKDIYGKEWNILEDGIKCIMTKSQFKLSKYYESWDDYKNRFKKNKCEICYAHEEEDRVKNSKINYQMLQTLSDMTDDEVDYVVKKSVESIRKITKDKDTIFRILGITDYNTNKNYLQKSIEAYPPLLSDSYTRKVVKQVKDKVVKDAKSGKVEISGKYVFMIPDLYAFCEHLFLGMEKPNGILKRGEISCNIYSNDKLACLRAPHLYREWGIRNNINDDMTKKWFVSNGLYMSSDDLLSKLVMNDWDSDKSLVVADNKIIEIAERHMVGINPVYYEMPIATSSELSLATRYKGLIDAYKGGGIGMYSNHITKIWNDARGEIDLDLIRYLVMVNNFQIDYSKTLFKVDIPKDINKRISAKTKLKTPFFFQYVKTEKTEVDVEPINNSTMNRVCAKIPNPNISFKNSQFGEFDYTMLMSDVNFDNSNVNNEILSMYLELIKPLKFLMDKKEIKNTIVPYHFTSIRSKMQECFEIKEVVDNLVYYSFMYKHTENKLALWTSFGDIIYENLTNNLKYRKPCERCGKLIEKSSNKTKYCEECGRIAELEKYKKYNKKR